MQVQEHPEYVRFEAILHRLQPTAISWSGDLFRYASPRYARSDDVATGRGSQENGGRWNAPGTFCAVYGSLDDKTAHEEMRARAARYGIALSDMLPLVLVTVSAALHQVLDLTDGAMRQALRVSQQRLCAEPWWIRQEAGEEALTQAMGRAAYSTGFEGLRVPCAVSKHGVNFVVFPANLSVVSRLTPHGVSPSMWTDSPSSS